MKIKSWIGIILSVAMCCTLTACKDLGAKNKIERSAEQVIYSDTTDANKTNLLVATGLLKPTKMKITTATSGDDAIALLKENEYDLILMDHMMPVKDGIETLHEIKSTFGNDFKTPIVVLTANAISGMRDMYIKEGFDDYLTKPISTMQLEEILVTFLGDYRQSEDTVLTQ